MSKKIVLTIPCLVVLLAGLVQHAPAHVTAGYRMGAVAGTATLACVGLLLLVRVWTGPELGEELREHAWQYGCAFVVLAAVAVGLGLARQGTPQGLSRAQYDLEAGFADGCSRNQPRPLCACLAKQLVEREGVSTPADVLALRPGMLRARMTGSFADLPIPMQHAQAACAQLARVS